MSKCNTTCPYCGVGCGVTAQVEDDQVIAVTGDENHPANGGRLCVKGTTLAETLVSHGRLLHPIAQGDRVSWDEGLELLAQKLQQTLEQYGPESIAFYLSGQLLTEDYYVANKLMKGFLGSANVDTNSRLCMSSAVTGYKRAFGADLVPCSYTDLEDCDLLVMVGSNAAWTHPVLYQRIVAAKVENPNKQIVVIDPRCTATSDTADLHLQLAPGSDGFLFAGLLVYLKSTGVVDDDFVGEHTLGLQQAINAAKHCDLETVAEHTGLSIDDLRTFYDLFAKTEKALTFYSQGINQSATGTDKCNAIINCHLLTGRLGKPGAGPFSITGQPNAMGGREVGGLANQLAAHMDFSNEDVERTGRFWQATNMATKPGLKTVDMFEAMANGKIRFIWIMATNPAVSLPDSARVCQALQHCDFVVLSDCIADTDTAAYADLLLPARGWGEKDGTVTNSERCISRQRQLVPASGEAMPDWWIVSQVAQRLGFREQFDYHSPAEIFTEHAALSGFENNGSRDFDISKLCGISSRDYDSLQPFYWPIRATKTHRVSPLADGFYHSDKRARFVSVVPQQPQQKSGDGTFILNTGRLRDQWHTMTRTGLVPKLMGHSEFFSIDINPLDAANLKLEDGNLVCIESDFGEAVGLANLSSQQPQGQLFSPIHWSKQFSGNACISNVVPPITDPLSGQPQSKYCEVKVLPLFVSAWAMLVSRQHPADCAAPFWSMKTVPGGYLTLIALDQQFSLENLKGALRRDGERESCRYQDSAQSDYREIAQYAGNITQALFIHAHRHSLPSTQWMANLLQREGDQEISHLLAGFDSDTENAGAMVCTCWEVGEQQITRAIEQGASSTTELGQQLRCGTQCGSCIPDLKRLLAVRSRDAA